MCAMPLQGVILMQHALVNESFCPILLQAAKEDDDEEEDDVMQISGTVVDGSRKRDFKEPLECGVLGSCKLDTSGVSQEKHG
ncbi:hypothetical protein Tco_0319622 [Tanacetum coccineum]